ncbi:MORN repeat-containing protein [Hirschia baltica]|uniref:Uncharacterized protein n=1 Tax=Hirschia baltica (strain ATCC 49814 / DSM 5838 / IFAM 1418) TaxID=582402 RepID=C6XR62_HIRBI|nr:hypothetical protein [Hirschia baltica]ACT60593.1 hypothetical protein Hbal_2924 [Hirschia baltica ATCC 49814]
MSTARPLTYMCDDIDPELMVEFLNWLRRFEVRTEEIDESSLHFPPDLILLGARSETFMILDPTTTDGSHYVVLDNDPPKQVAKGVFRITTATMSGLEDEWKTLLRVIGRQIGMPSLPFRAKEIFEEGEDSLNIDFVELEESIKQADEARMERYTLTFARKAGTEFQRLVDAEDYTDEAGQAFISARYSERRAEEAAAMAREELGKSFSHTKPNSAGVCWGRIKWKKTEFVEDILYEGETDGIDAHGFGILTQKVDGRDQTYSGQFINGVRVGFGVGFDDVLTWVGAWFGDQPHGHGVFLQGKNKESANHVQGEVYVPLETENYMFKKEQNKKLGRFKGRNSKTL